MTTYNFSNDSTVTSFVVDSDKLSFASEISAASVTFIQSSDDLKITAGTQVTTINNLTMAQLLSSNLLFADGSLYLAGTSSADSLSGTSAADQLSGLGGDDTIDGGAGSDWLAGGVLAPGFVDLQVNGGGGVMVGPGTDLANY